MAVERWGIIGGGFGLYGYLPALAKSGVVKILVPLKNRSTIEKREELAPYLSAIEWADDIAHIIANADALVIAVPPTIQERLISALRDKKNLQYIILEKPIASSPAIAQCILNEAIRVAKKVRVGYSCTCLDWAHKLKELIKNKNNSYFIKWRFMAHHYKLINGSWKANAEAGGGALRFYGIHMLAVIQSLGLCKIISSKIFCKKNMEAFRWRAEFETDRRGRLIVDVNTASEVESFEIEDEQRVKVVHLKNPFSEENIFEGEDNRINSLMRLLATFDDPNLNYYKFYFRVNELWAETEQQTQFCLVRF